MTMSSDPKASRVITIRKPEPQTNPGNICGYLLVLCASVIVGFLTFNFFLMLKVSHVHLSLAHHHRTTAFCAFIGCTYIDDMRETSDAALDETTATNISENKTSSISTSSSTTANTESGFKQSSGSSTQAAGNTSTDRMLGDATTKTKDTDLAQTTEALKSRVCGSPAVDGYAHVNATCLEESPTAQWWKKYYSRGGNQSDLVVHIERHADYDGLAVVWGIGNNYDTVEQCAEHCKRHMPGVVPGPFINLPCNAFAFCPDETCFEPDAHKHHKGNCWLKFTEGPAYPEVNMRGDLPEDYKKRHPAAPDRVQWHSGVLLPKGVPPSKGIWGPRWKW